MSQNSISSADAVRRAYYRTDLAVQDEKIVLQWYAQVPLFGYLFSYIVYSLSSQTAVDAQDRCLSDFVQIETGKVKSQVESLFTQDAAESVEATYSYHQNVAEIARNLKLAQNAAPSFANLVFTHYEAAVSEQGPDVMKKIERAYKVFATKQYGEALATSSKDLQGKSAFEKHRKFWNTYHSLLSGEWISKGHLARSAKKMRMDYPISCILNTLNNLPEERQWQKENKKSAFEVFIKSIDHDEAEIFLSATTEEKEKFLVSANRFGVLSLNPVFSDVAIPELEKIIAPQVPGVFYLLLDDIVGQLKKAGSIHEDVFTSIQGLRDQKGDAPSDFNSAFEYLENQMEALTHILTLVPSKTLADIKLPCTKEWVSSVLPIDNGLTCKNEHKCEIHSALEASQIKSMYHTLLKKDHLATELKGRSSFDFIDYFKSLMKVDFRLAIDLMTKMEGFISDDELSGAVEAVIEKYESESYELFYDIDNITERNELFHFACRLFGKHLDFYKRMNLASAITDELKDDVLVKMLEQKYWKSTDRLERILEEIANKDECSERLLGVVVKLVDEGFVEQANVVAKQITKSPFKEAAQAKVSKQ